MCSIDYSVMASLTVFCGAQLHFIVELISQDLSNRLTSTDMGSFYLAWQLLA